MNIWWPIQFFYCAVASFVGIAESITILTYCKLLVLCLLNPKLYSEYAAAIPIIFGIDTIARNKIRPGDFVTGINEQYNPTSTSEIF